MSEAWRSEIELVPDDSVLGSRHHKYLIGPGVKVEWSDVTVLEALNLEYEKRAIAEGLAAYRAEQLLGPQPWKHGGG